MTEQVNSVSTFPTNSVICITCKAPKTAQSFRKLKGDKGFYKVCIECRAVFKERYKGKANKRRNENRRVDGGELYRNQRRVYGGRRFFYVRASNMLSADNSRRKFDRGVVVKEATKMISLLWKEQKGLCSLTGRRLNRENSQLDHIIPRKRGGTSEKSNLRWIHRDANYAKRDLLDSELYLLCFEMVKMAMQRGHLPSKIL